ncbi:carbohydrate kinase [Devosia pacifica]|uniref:Carbohydrate kinase n=1 Tax=Devosia pacifica TaxID=1335967 RepID=A0A918S8E4_9HYPH|nr:FGGY-family carbohydrate kinase [Devosia pacifica]GHA29073.1 carbohydrate kinase [Devosia pacifica]
MPTPRAIAVIDIGKTNAKLALIEAATGNQIDRRSMVNTPLDDGPYPHANVAGLWLFICDALRELNVGYGIDAISITTHGATAALLDGDGLALPVLDYEFDGPDTVRADYEAVRPDFRESYSPSLPAGLNLGAQIFWQERTYPEEFSHVTDILTYPQYWAWRLTGVKASEVTSLGCHTDLWAPDRRDYSRMVSERGWRARFPELKPAASVLGTLVDEVAQLTGLPASTPVACGIHDSNASLLPHLDARQTPFTVISAGTWTICMTVGGKTETLDRERDSLANVDMHARPTPTARFMGGREFEILAGRSEAAAPSEADIAAVLDQQILVLPSFVEGVGPFPDQKGRWSHDPAQLSDGQRVAAISLYLAMMTREALQLCGVGREIVVEGSLARNALYAQALAKLTNVDVSVSDDATGTSLGASKLFGAASGAASRTRPVTALQSAKFDAYSVTWRSHVTRS